jgi:hypothetical protein
VLVERGAGIVVYGGSKHIFSSPILLCLGENEKPQLTKSEDLQAQAIYFHPSVINKGFDFQNVSQPDQQGGVGRSDVATTFLLAR